MSTKHTLAVTLLPVSMVRCAMAHARRSAIGSALGARRSALDVVRDKSTLSCLCRSRAPSAERRAPSAERRALRRQACRGGFTLLEMLVVITIIVVITVLLLPVLAQARERARQSVGLSNLRQIAQAELLYMADWDEQFPHWFCAAPPRPMPFGKFAFWPEYFQPYLHGQAILRDPSAYWPWDLTAQEKLAEYALVTWGRAGKGTAETPHWRWPGPPLSLTSVPRPAETIAVMDGWTGAGWTRVDLRRHTGGMNASFVDGHAHWLGKGEFWRVDTDGRGSYWFHYAAADR